MLPDFVHSNIMAYVICLIRLIKIQIKFFRKLLYDQRIICERKYYVNILFLHKYDVYYTDWYTQIVIMCCSRLKKKINVNMFCNMHKMLQCAVRKFSFYMSLLKICICIVQNISNILIFSFVLCIKEF